MIRHRLPYPVRWLAYLASQAGYWVRPYDQIADRRRWRWQRPAPCGYQVGLTLTGAEAAELRAHLLGHRDDR